MALVVTREQVQKTVRRQAKLGWDVPNHVEMYQKLHFRGRVDPGEGVVRKYLVAWKADLGARHKMDWKGFEKQHRKLLADLEGLPRLGKLTDEQMDLVCAVISRLELYKNTDGRMLVFGSKTAHFHFPALAPVMSSEVKAGLLYLQKHHREDLERHLAGHEQKPGRWFRWEDEASNRASFENYLRLGNALMRDQNGASLLGVKESSIGLEAKAFEWWAISFSY